MANSGTAPQFAVLSKCQLKDRHLGTRELLQGTGVGFHPVQVLEMLKEAA